MTRSGSELPQYGTTRRVLYNHILYYHYTYRETSLTVFLISASVALWFRYIMLEVDVTHNAPSRYRPAMSKSAEYAANLALQSEWTL